MLKILNFFLIIPKRTFLKEFWEQKNSIYIFKKPSEKTPNPKKMNKISNSNNISGGKNSFYFLNKIMAAQKNEMSDLWSETNKRNIKLESPHQISRFKYTVSNKHWKKAIQSILEKGAEMSDLEKKILSFWLKMTIDPEKYMKDQNDNEIIRFRNVESRHSFILKCKTSIHDWLKKNLLKCETFKEKVSQIEEKFLNDWLDGDNSNVGKDEKNQEIFSINSKEKPLPSEKSPEPLTKNPDLRKPEEKKMPDYGMEIEELKEKIACIEAFLFGMFCVRPKIEANLN